MWYAYRELRKSVVGGIATMMAFAACGGGVRAPSPTWSVCACPNGAASAERLWKGISPQVKDWELGGRQKVLDWFSEHQFGKTPCGRLPDEVIGESSVSFTNAGLRIEICCRLPAGADAAHPVPVFLFGDHRGGRDLFPLLRKEPAAQVMWGPLLLAKSVRTDCTEAQILDPMTVNRGGWTLRAAPAKGVANVWGAWDLEFVKDGQKRSVRVCDYSSAAIWGQKGVEFSVFF